LLRAFGLVLAAAASAWAAAAPDVIAVVTTSTDLKALVAAVGGERVAVESLAPPLHDPHAVEITPGQLARLRSAALLVRIGLDHEPWLARVRAVVNDPRSLPTGRAISISPGESTCFSRRRLASGATAACTSTGSATPTTGSTPRTPAR